MRKLYTSSRDRKIFGVCGGVAEYLNIDATLLRILLIVVAVFSAGSVIVVYILAGFIIPREPAYGSASFGAGPFGGAPDSGGKWGGGYNGWTPPPHTGSTSGWTPGPSPWPGPGTGARSAKPEPAQTASSASPGLDAMMDDIEKKALKRELEELKARIAKFEQQQSKGE